MEILIALDSFKDALNSTACCTASAFGFEKSSKKIQTRIFPISDGGEGFLEVMQYHTKGELVKCTVHDPLFRIMEAGYLLSTDKKTAYIEMAAASGLQLLKPAERNCLYTTSLGTGELIYDAASKGVNKIYLGIGGSATNDAGVGLASALGYRFLDKGGKAIHPVGGKLENIHKIDDQDLRLDPGQLDVEVLCDVENPLYGPEGAAFVYGIQKGATTADLDKLDKGLRHLSELIFKWNGQEVHNLKGAGAAGGAGAGARVFLGAKIKNGISTILEMCRFDSYLEKCDIVITGEGKIDKQTIYNKAVKGISTRASSKGKFVIGLCGNYDVQPGLLDAIGLDSAFAITNGPSTLKESLANTEKGLWSISYRLGKLLTK